MLPTQEELPLSQWSGIYDVVVPKDNRLRRMNDLVDFSFILEELKSKYCQDNGRKAICPIQMFKYLILKSIFELSDVDVVERSQYDMSFKYFLDIAPDAKVIDPSSLTKFRRKRLLDNNLLDLLIEKTVQLALEHQIIKKDTIIVDATHTRSRYQSKSAMNFIQEKSKQLRKTIYQYDETIREQFPTKSTSENIQDELTYTQQLVSVIEKNPSLLNIPSVSTKLNVVKEVLQDCEHESKLSEDKDAKTGYKSADHSFFGFKSHLSMTDERIITAAVITAGDKADGKYLADLVEKSEAAGMEIRHVIGDTAYSGRT
ncbi:MAG: transposase, partial [Planococcaceae bacterium]|nr:transposase [Planococcaceae bacterium]